MIIIVIEIRPQELWSIPHIPVEGGWAWNWLWDQSGLRIANALLVLIYPSISISLQDRKITIDYDPWATLRQMSS